MRCLRVSRVCVPVSRVRRKAEMTDMPVWRLMESAISSA